MLLFEKKSVKNTVVPAFNYSPDKSKTTKLLSFNDTRPGILVLSDQGFEKLNDSDSYAIFIRNVPDISNNTETYKPTFSLYRKEFDNKSEPIVWFCYPNKIKSVLGRWFDSGLYYAIVDVPNKRINGYKSYFRYEDVLLLKDVKLTEDFFLYLDKTILVHPFYPKYEKIAWPAPFFGHYIAPVFYLKFEKEEKEELVFVLPKECKNDYHSDWDLVVKRPKFLFAKDIEASTIYKWDFENNNWVEVSFDNGEYLTYDELLTKGHTYTEYLQIPDEAFQSLEKWYVVNNSYILPFQIRDKYFEDVSQGTAFFYNYYDEVTHRLVALEI